MGKRITGCHEETKAVLDQQLIEDTYKIIKNNGGKFPPVTISFEAFEKANKICKLHPDLILDSEAIIWYYANKMNL